MELGKYVRGRGSGSGLSWESKVEKSGLEVKVGRGSRKGETEGEAGTGSRK